MAPNQWAPAEPRATDAPGRPLAGTFSGSQPLHGRRETHDSEWHPKTNLASMMPRRCDHADSTSLPSSISTTGYAGSSDTIPSSPLTSPGRGAAGVCLTSPEMYCQRSSICSQGSDEPLRQLTVLSQDTMHNAAAGFGALEQDSEAFGPWCRANGAKMGQGAPSANIDHSFASSASSSESSSGSSSGSDSSSGSSSDSSSGSRLSFAGPQQRRSAESHRQAPRRRPISRGDRSSSETKGHVSVHFDDTALDEGFVRINRHKPGMRAQALLSRRTQQQLGGVAASQLTQPGSRVYWQMQKHLFKHGEANGDQEGALQAKLQVEEGLRKQRLAEPMRQRLLRQYTEDLRRLDAAKAEANRCEEQADKLRPLLVKVVLAASKLKTLQSSGSWREYLGASVTDVDADIANFMTSFGEDLANLEANDAAIASKGSPACSRFWKRRTLAGAFLTLMVLYIVVIGGVFVWLHQGGPTFAPANSTKGGGY